MDELNASDAAPELGADITSGSPESTAQEQALEELFELKVDGETQKLTKQQLIAQAQKAKAAEKRMQTAAQERDAAKKLVDLAKNDPVAFLKHLNGETFNEKDFFAKRLAALMEDEMLSPEEKQQRADMMELQELRKQAKEAKERLESERLQKEAEALQVEIDKEMADAIAAVGLPKTRAAVKRVAEYALDALENGLNVPMAKIAAQVKKDIQQEVLDLLGQSDEDAFEQLLGSDLLKKAQKTSLKVKKPGEPVTPKEKAEIEKTKEKEKKRLTAADLHKEWGLL